MAQMRFFKGKEKIIILFLLSVVVRLCVFVYHFFFFSWPLEPWDQLIIGMLEPYFDYKYYYREFAQEFINGNWFPYISETSDQILDSYVYPPLFLYIIAIPAIFSVDLVFIPLFLADLFLPFVIYRLLARSSEEEVAEWGFLAVLFCPLSIVYNGGLFFNTSLVVLIFIVSIYFVHVKRFKYATLTLAASFLLKQIILIFILPILLYIILKSSENNYISYLKQISIYSGILIGTIFVGSLPWILVSPGRYLESIFMSQQITFNPTFISRELTWPVHWYSFLIELHAPYWFLYITGFLNFTMLGLISLQVINTSLLVHWQNKNSLNWLKFLDLIVFTAILSHLFLPRGVFKYYFTLHVPLVILWICFHFGTSLTSSTGHKKVFLIFLVACLTILLIHRLFYLLVVWGIFFLMFKIALNNN
ncbi:MAG: hypothetical protein ACFFAE_11045, partial [Candidatus Hodarchaeota archaeon]